MTLIFGIIFIAAFGYIGIRLGRAIWNKSVELIDNTFVVGKKAYDNLPSGESVKAASTSIYKEIKKALFILMAWLTLLAVLGVVAVGVFGPFVI